MIKNFGKIRQWAGEKLGASHGTLPSEEFKDFQSETKQRHEDFDQMRHTLELAVQYIQKNKITSDNGSKRAPLGAYGEALVCHANMFPRDSIQWNALTTLGLGECRLSEMEDEFAKSIKDDYMVVLQQFNQNFKEYLTLCRKLESRRLDYDAKYNRLQKAKKESPDSEQSVQAAKVKYEETEFDVVQCMITLQETEDDHIDALRNLLQNQLSYHKEAVKILENANKKWDQCDGQDTRINNDQKDSDTQKVEKNQIKGKQRKAIYEHVQDHPDELTFHVNDIINVVDKVDNGWWLGEMPVKNGQQNTRGIFPVNYTIPYPDANDESMDTDDNSKNHSSKMEISKNGTVITTSLQGSSIISPTETSPDSLSTTSTSPPLRPLSTSIGSSPSSASSSSPGQQPVHQILPTSSLRPPQPVFPESLPTTSPPTTKANHQASSDQHQELPLKKTLSKTIASKDSHHPLPPTPSSD
ncbi:uncharacterized protein BX664DRAFT_334725 [Halteromyces radiatus]|uniref:uncharacterized protein n=1 Tax=Halteromyces radiatus TaxID=101107 RepID=UPI0022207B58|nr:uncharacterized protein BX664DRAFT_334725 [Halteromyces radiatus]KAI8086028.1 hypothetical protein BX664DRAFT_334725 [Halteromyces radiatus]